MQVLASPLTPALSEGEREVTQMKVPLLDLQAQYATIRDEVTVALARVFESQHFVLGAEVQALEEEIAQYSQTKFAVGCASGSDALLLALMSCGVGEGDEVITTPFSFFATASSVTRLGARPVFVDIDERTYNINPAQLAEAINERTKAIMPVHLYGQCAEMDAINELANKRGVTIIEDAAQAIGAEDNGRRAGSMSAIGCISFYPSKNLGGAGDGGMLVTSDPDHAARLRVLRVHGEKRQYYHQWVGINSRLDALQAVVLRVKMKYLDDWTIQRQRNAETYEALFNEAGLAEKLTLPMIRRDGRHVFHQYVVRVSDGRRDELRDYLKGRGVGTGVYYPLPLHMQECFADLGYQNGDFPITERAALETLALPVYPELTEEHLRYVVTACKEFFSL